MTSDLKDAGTSSIRGRAPWMMIVVVLFILLVPPYVAPLAKRILWPPLLLSVGLLTLGVVKFFVDRRTNGITTIKPGVIIILGFLVLAFVPFVPRSPSGGLDVFKQDWRLPLIFLLSYVGIALYAMTQVTTPRDRELTLIALTAGLIFMCLVGVLQNYANLDLRLLFKLPGLGESQQMAQLSTTSPTANVATLDRFDAKRSFGTADHASDFSILAAVSIPLCIHFVRFGSNGILRAAAGVGTGVAFIAILAGVSRSGLIALAGALLVYVWAMKIRTLASMILSGAVVIVAVAAVLGPDKVIKSGDALLKSVNEGASLSDPSVVARVERYAAISQVFFENKVAGLGVGRFPPGIGVLDNQWLKAIVEGGLTGLAGMLLLAIGGIVGIAAALRRVNGSRERDEAYAVGAMFTGILFSSFGIDLFLFAQVSMVFFLLFGLLWSTFSIPVSALPGFLGRQPTEVSASTRDGVSSRLAAGEM